MGRRSARWDDGAFVVEGRILIEEALRSGWEIEAQYVAPGGEPVEGADCPIFDLAANVIERVASTEAPQPLRVRRARAVAGRESCAGM